MLELIKTEYKKYFLNRKVGIALLVLLGLFTYFSSIGQASNHGVSSIGHHISSFAPTKIDEQFKADYEHDYRDYVDSHLAQREEIAQRLKELQDTSSVEDLLRQRYDQELSHILLTQQALESTQFQQLEQRFQTIYEQEHRRELALAHNPTNDSLSPQLTQPEQQKLEHIVDQGLMKADYIRGEHTGPEYLTSNMQFLPFFLGFFLVIALYPVFSWEKQRKSDALILTTKRGKNDYILAKLLAVISFTVMSWVLFQVMNLLACYIVYGLQGMQVSVFSSNFPSPYGFTYGSYYIHQLLISLIATVAVAMIICFVSQLTKPIPTLFIMCILVFFSSIFRSSQMGFDTAFKLFLLPPTQMMSAYNTYEQFDPIHFFIMFFHCRRYLIY